MKKITALFLSAVLFISTLSITVTNINIQTIYADGSWPKGPSMYGTSCCLIEASTGTVLYSKKPHKKMYPASITKILTALVTLENASLDEEVTFSQNAIDSLEYDAANLQMVAGEIMSVEDCLYGLMLHSANEVATALAEHVGGSVEGFADMMNKRAKEAGATDSHFMNANGLHNDDHYLTSYDMAMITRAAVQNPVFLSISGATNYTLGATNKKDAMTIYQRHKMTHPSNAYYYEGILGGKTGFTDQAGTTLVSYAERDGMTLIAVVLQSNGYNAYEDTIKLFDFGFENFHLVNVSDNDTRFRIDTDSYTDKLTSAFGFHSSSYLEINKNDNIVLPKNAKFSDVTSNVLFETTDTAVGNNVASIEYTYDDVNVGSASIIYTNAGNAVSEDSQNDSGTTETTSDVTDPKSKHKTNIFSQLIKKIKSIKIKKDTLIKIAIGFIILIFMIWIILFIRKKHRELNEARERKRHRNRNLDKN